MKLFTTTTLSLLTLLFCQLSWSANPEFKCIFPEQNEAYSMPLDKNSRDFVFKTTMNDRETDIELRVNYYKNLEVLAQPSYWTVSIELSSPWLENQERELYVNIPFHKSSWNLFDDNHPEEPSQYKGFTGTVEAMNPHTQRTKKFYCKILHPEQ